jgi:OmpA-OmpF porin, OOP family
MSRALVSSIVLVLFASCGVMPARAEIEGPRIGFSPHLGAALWLDDIDLATDVLFGGRVGLGMNPWVGIEGTIDVTPTHLDGDSDAFERVTHASLGVIFRLLPYRAWTPYLVGGYANLHFDPSGGGESNIRGFEAGGGFEVRLLSAPGRRVDLRVDARNVFLDADAPSLYADSIQNTLLLTAGLNFTMGGSPRDTDGDGVPDRLDACGGTPPGATVDARGCPSDSDGDGIFDGIDRCPDTQAGALVDAYGCPVDSDGDGVFDGIDRCPDTPARAIVDARGCPIDSDGDGVYDGLDRCPETPAGAVVDESGCPIDSDGDGVYDGIDRCPDTPSGVKVDERGCPIPTSIRETELLDTGLIRLSNVRFESGKATLRPESYVVLREVGAILARWPQLRIEIGGHTDSIGPEDFNLRLSEQRAQAVYEWLVENFPSASTSQYIVRGYGESRSIATNDTAEGRAENRRVEFRVLNREVLEQ